jgi:hypothetical protein
MKVSYVVTLNAQELKSVARIMKEIAPTEALKQGTLKITQKSKLASTLVKFKLKRTAKLEMEMEVSEDYLAWYADSVERLAPLVRGLIPQMVNLGEEAKKCATRAPQDTAPITVTDDE